MKQALQVFKYREDEIRTVVVNGEILFVVSDLCRALEIKNVSQAARALDEDEKGICNVYTPGGWQEMLCANEPGYYHLIFTSRKESAKAFKRWVTHEVIPAIRKTGSYSLAQPAETSPIYTVADALRDRVLPNIKHVPRGFFTVAGELFKHLHNLERLLNRTLDNKAEIEKSVGRRWSDYAREVLRIPEDARRTYPHVCPSGYIAHPWAYSMLYVADFDRWLWEVYFPEEFPLYVRDRAQRTGQKQISTKAVRTQVLLARCGMTQLSLFSEALGL